MGLLNAIRGPEKTIVPAPLGLEIMLMMGMIRWYKDGVYMLNMPPPEPVEIEGDVAEGPQPAQEPQPEHTEAKAPHAA